MNLKELTIEGYKSIGKITLSNPNPFTVFVGPNASGKSNIFEAIEFLALCTIMAPKEVANLYGNVNEIFNQVPSLSSNKIGFSVSLENLQPLIELYLSHDHNNYGISGDRQVGTYNRRVSPERIPPGMGTFWDNPDYKHFFNFTRLFIGQPSRLPKNDDSRLSTYGYTLSNLEKVLKRILKDEKNRIEIHETLQLLVPGFERVEIVSSELSGTDSLIVYETNLKRPLTKELISDGTFNIISILAAIYQSDEPQFLCIEEPENGINPMVVRELVSLMRDKCKEKGHYIWLNTHSQTLVSELTTEEIILVDKVKGLTQIKQIQGMDLFGLRMDEALLTNSLGGGIPW